MSDNPFTTAQMLDLNDLFLFAQVVKCGGFNATSRQTNIPKATISRRIAKLEQQLGVKLLHRTTHSINLTNAGALYYPHCVDFLEQALATQKAMQQSQYEPCGTIRFSCPVEMLELWINPLLVQFMQQYPKIHFDVWGINRYVDIIEENCDFAIRARSYPLPDQSMIMRKFCSAKLMLVSSPKLISKPLSDISLLQDYPSCSNSNGAKTFNYQWKLKHHTLGWQTVNYQPKLTSKNIDLLKQAVLAGLGIAMLPQIVIQEELKKGLLINVLSDEWDTEDDVLHAIYPDKQTILPAVKLFLDYLSEHFQYDL